MKNAESNLGNEFCWWLEPWWTDPNYVHPYKVEDVAQSVEILKSILSEKWFLDASNKCPQHYFLSRLVGKKGSSVAAFIVGLAQTMKYVSGADGFEKKLDELKTARHMSVYFEMSTAAALSSQGAKISFPKEGKSKVPDITAVTPNAQFSVECKRLEEEQWQKWESELLRRLSMSQIGFGDEKWRFEIELNERLSELRMDDQFNDINEQLLVQFEFVIGEAIKELPNMLGEEWLSIQGVGRVRRLLAREGVYGKVSGFAISPVAKLRRILRNGFLEAIEQLPTSMPGVVAVFSFHQTDIELAKIALQAICEARPKQTDHVVALLLCPGGTIFKHNAPALLINRKSRFNAAECIAVKMMEKAWEIQAM